MGNDNYISDSGVVHKTKWADIITITLCTIASVGLIYLGFMAYYVR